MTNNQRFQLQSILYIFLKFKCNTFSQEGATIKAAMLYLKFVEKVKRILYGYKKVDEINPCVSAIISIFNKNSRYLFLPVTQRDIISAFAPADRLMKK